MARQVKMMQDMARLLKLR